MKLIASLGTSPGGIAETFSYIANTYKAVPSEVIVITTSSPKVDKAYNVLLEIFSKCVRPKFGEVVIERLNISSDDIYSSQDLWELSEKVKGKMGKGDFVDVTGGRKVMSIALALVAIRSGAKVVTTVIPQEEYNRIQSLMEKGYSDPCELLSKQSRTIELYLE
mgnify:CR=1 FL=1